MTRQRNHLLRLGVLGGFLLLLPGCMQAERMAYERHLSAVVQPLPVTSVSLGIREPDTVFVSQVD